jgi:hypothetical protein
LSDVSFTLNNTISALPSPKSVGITVNIKADGSATTSPLVGSPNRWHVSGGGSTFDVTALGGGQPHFMVAPGGNNYPNVNGGVQNFNSYYDGSVTVLISGITIPDGTTVSNVVLSFGTGPDTTIAAGGQAVPTADAPPSIVLTIPCVLALGCYGLVSSFRRGQIRPGPNI